MTKPEPILLTNTKPLTDSLDNRRKMIEWLKNNATVRLSCLPEDTNPEDELEFPEQIAFANSGKPWAWCRARVSVSYGGFTGTDYLGACSYNSEEDFRADAYFTDMVEAACVDLVAYLMNARETAMRIWSAANP